MTRVLQEDGFDYWESGMDLHLGDDMYDSFVAYQNRMMSRFDKMVEDCGFTVIDACRSIDAVFADLKAQMSELLYAPRTVSGDVTGRFKPSRHEAATANLEREETLAKQYAS